jgi:hypothetical protein
MVRSYRSCQQIRSLLLEHLKKEEAIILVFDLPAPLVIMQVVETSNSTL